MQPFKLVGHCVLDDFLGLKYSTFTSQQVVLGKAPECTDLNGEFSQRAEKREITRHFVHSLSKGKLVQLSRDG